MKNQKIQKSRKPPPKTTAARRPRAAPPTPSQRATHRACWCIKTEPTLYSYADLEREGRVTWDGVANNLALIHLRAMLEGDLVLVYHAGGEKAVAGLARVAKGPYPDPVLGDARRVVVDLVPIARAEKPVSIAAIREAAACQGLALLRIPRLSVMPVAPAAFAAIAKKGGLPAGTA